MPSSDPTLSELLQPLLGFLPCRTPAGWVTHALGDLDLLLQDHASLELKAAEQAQKLIRRFGAARTDGGRYPAAFRSRLVNRLSRLAREELRHFEQVVALIERRGGEFTALSASRYAAGLHAEARRSGAGAVVDALIIGAIIEARSCERFLSLVEAGPALDETLAAFYRSLLKSEARHFEVYLDLARRLDDPELEVRIRALLTKDRELIESADDEFRFHSGVPGRLVQSEAE